MSRQRTSKEITINEYHIFWYSQIVLNQNLLYKTCIKAPVFEPNADGKIARIYNQPHRQYAIYESKVRIQVAHYSETPIAVITWASSRWHRWDW